MTAVKLLQRVVATGAFLALAAGCASLGAPAEKPKISLSSIRVLEIRGLETAFEVDLRVINPSQNLLSITGIDCELTLNGRQLARGVANPQIEIGAYADAIVPVKVYSSMFDMISIARRMIKHAGNQAAVEKLTYALSGHLQTDAAGWLGRIPFDSQGEIDLEGLARPIP